MGLVVKLFTIRDKNRLVLIFCLYYKLSAIDTVYSCRTVVKEFAICQIIYWENNCRILTFHEYLPELCTVSGA